MLNYEVKFLTCDETLQLKKSDYKTWKYEVKKKTEDTVYDIGKRSYCERRGGHWRAVRTSQIRQLEAQLRERSVVSCDWTSESLITIVFSSGAIAYITVQKDTLDVTKILFDRYCIGKLNGQTVSEVVTSKSHILFIHAEKLATLVTFGKTSTSSPCRIADRDPHLQCLELSGGSRRAERRVSSCGIGAGLRVLVWGAASVEPAPWSPVIEDTANLHIYDIEGQQVSLIAYHQLENETLFAELSQKPENIVHIAEQTTCHKNGVSLSWDRYELPVSPARARQMSSLRRSSAAARLPAPARSVRRSACDSRLLAACIDGSLHCIHHVAGLTHSTRLGFIATDVRWVGEVILTAEEGGRLQCYDRALSLLNHHSKCIDISAYLIEARRMQILSTRTIQAGTLVLATFVGGPLTLLRIRHPSLVTSWLRSGRVMNAVSLLRALDWELEGTTCLRALQIILQHILRRGLKSGESEAQGEAALGAYFAPTSPHSRIGDRFAPAVHDIARKFFHHLLRGGRVEKALSLCVELRAWDACCDVRWRCLAAPAPAPALAAEAAHLAHHFALQHHESDDSNSCSRSSCDSYSTSSEEEEEGGKETARAPPPLPRPPPRPAPCTTSIRPNLHQYLDKDDTIWNTEVQDDTFLTGKEVKPILNHHPRWHSVDDVLSCRPKQSNLLTIDEGPSKSQLVNIIPRNDDRVSAAYFKNLYQTELREEAPKTLYRYKNNYIHNTNTGAMGYKKDQFKLHGEKNKVKFSDTITIAVVSEPLGIPEPSVELAESLPLCSPHNYLSAFSPAAPTPSHAPCDAGTDYVEV